MRRSALALVSALAAAAAAFGDIRFSGPDLSQKDELLFSAEATLPGGGAFRTLFSADVAAGKLRQLTFYPERVTLVDRGRRLQVQNRYGVFRTGADFRGMEPVPGFPAFTRGSPAREGKLPGVQASPDGTRLLYMDPASPAYGRLILFDVATGGETVVSADVAQYADRIPALWSPDSRHFVYAKGGNLHYYSLDQHEGKRVLDESFRRVGPGRIENAQWNEQGSLYILRHRSLYRILPAEFFAQALYAGVVSIGTMVGKVPFPFDPNFDSYRVSPDGRKILLCKDGRNLFLYYLDPDDFGKADRVAALPYLFLQGNTTVTEVLWPESAELTILTSSLRDGERVSGAYRIAAPDSPADLSLTQSFKTLDASGAVSVELSPDRKRVALANDRGVVIRRYADWSAVTTLDAPGTLHALWASDERLVLAGSRTIELAAADGSERVLLALSQADRYGWAPETPGTVAALAGNSAWTLEPGSKDWKRAAAFKTLPASGASPAYRVYLDELDSGSYRNIVMVRSIQGFGTKPLLLPAPRPWAPFPERDEPRSPGIFDHGSRIRRRQVALVFNAYDSSEGLTGILNTLADYRIRATFFVNGEFVRRNPGAARLIAESGHETGNMFFTTYDPTDARFRVDAEFVKRGLARTEDEYFAATGRDLSLLWHTPHYSTSTEILEAASRMNYTFVGRDVDPLDWVSETEGKSVPGLYLDAHRIVERVLAKVKPGSIVPVRVGVPEGGRQDYLFRELSLLVNGLLAEGYEIVPVSTLIEHAR
ncbi:MAG TPA: polysaccharide deacetylase family protein [Spirochaetia bacterium]|nr:polysaccharide deacetylase family protein [Spirochaetales bacterium]HRY80001.1 polysaccharide deacetylase family protein [Spirochaetia bacterium]